MNSSTNNPNRKTFKTTDHTNSKFFTVPESSLHFGNQEIAAVYREIGKVLCNHGAMRVYILQSKTLSDNSGIHMSLEVATDRLTNQESAISMIQKTYPQIDCTLIDGSADKNYDLLREAEEDRIQL